MHGFTVGHILWQLLRFLIEPVHRTFLLKLCDILIWN